MYGDCVVSVVNGQPHIERADSFIGITDQLLSALRKNPAHQVTRRRVTLHCDNGDITYRLMAYRPSYKCWDAVLLVDGRH